MRGKTNAEYIREELNKNFDAPTDEIVNRLGGIGINVTHQHVYAQRSWIRGKKKEIQEKRNMTNQLNQVPLADYITTILATKPEGLSDYGLLDAIKAQGYITHSDDFMQVLRKKLYTMTENRILLKDGTQYSLTIRAKNAKNEAEAAVDAEIAALDVGMIAPDANDLSNYELLCQAVISFAKAKGLENPESLPKTLIETQKKLNESQKLIAAQKEAIAKAEQDALALHVAALNIFKEKE